MFKYLKYLITVSIYVLVACKKDHISEEENFVDQNYTPGEENLVGKFSIEAFSADNTFNQAIPGLTNDQSSLFGVGHAIANQNWVQAPASTTTRDGLGPIFNARACASCHPKDGRGKPMLENNEASQGFLIRLSQAGSNGIGPHGAPLDFPIYGGQLQNLAILTNSANSTVKKEADIHVSFNIIKGTYNDGEAYELRKPTYTIVNANYGDISTALTSPRVGNQVIGLGFVDALSEQSILANADENDTDKDGISGKANYIWDVVNKKLSIGKFGWKSNQPTLRQQISGALSGDMGITSNIFPEPNYDKPDWSKLANGINLRDSVEIPEKQFSRLLLYQTALSVPVRRNYKDIDVLKGKVLFNNLACVKCHVNKFTTSKYDYLPILGNVVIRPYSDFLLHDMGDDLTDNRPFYLATANEWRTAPLWGIGMIKAVNNHTFFLHDGRARNIEEAILWHGGEAEKSKNDFKKLAKTERTQLLKFLNSL